MGLMGKISGPENLQFLENYWTDFDENWYTHVIKNEKSYRIVIFAKKGPHLPKISQEPKIGRMIFFEKHEFLTHCNYATNGIVLLQATAFICNRFQCSRTTAKNVCRRSTTHPSGADVASSFRP